MENKEYVEICVYKDGTACINTIKGKNKDASKWLNKHGIRNRENTRCDFFISDSEENVRKMFNEWLDNRIKFIPNHIEYLKSMDMVFHSDYITILNTELLNLKQLKERGI